MSACSCRRGLSFLGRGLLQSQGIIGQFEVTRTAGDAQAIIKSPVAPVAFDVGFGVNPHLLGEIGFLLLLGFFHWGLRQLYTGRAAAKTMTAKISLASCLGVMLLAPASLGAENDPV